MPARPLAQDFASAAPWDVRGGDALLESALPGRSAAPGVVLAGSRWLALPELETRSVAFVGGWRSLRAAAGVSQTGDLELGYSAAGAALGIARPGAGVGLRAVARRDRLGDPAAGGSGRDADPPGAGLECGAGAWFEAGPGVLVWASAPQMWEQGDTPPLERGLTLGARLESAGLLAWLARESLRADDALAIRAAHRVGVALEAGPLEVWVEAHDAPLRAGIGVTARVGRIEALASVEGHPVLGETTRLALRLGGGGASP